MTGFALNLRGHPTLHATPEKHDAETPGTGASVSESDENQKRLENQNYVQAQRLNSKR